ncbi:MAG: amidohydrolase [Gluconobacter potus]|uniref:Amidohydrolase n=1 Tax=Gluconobacter potus TaxID=2724927 RepID=A0ABR9YJM1_9PROT|nr:MULTISPECIES: amidohydrolase [Gluconobacter]MBF0863398.1 amidohydrolase [Gluconobacter sp. R71656]MBF0866205.1 amidohydrolase [Gluconobacter sp. R75628]MBF0872667.1 amidohydrolase [Gluconobacter sp. R75629]MBF0881633.1 amidohydrolase [Gluconobacter potus]
MLKRRDFLSAGVGCALPVLGFPAIAASSREGVETAYINAMLWDGYSAAPSMSAIGVTGEHVSCVGAEAVKARISKRTRVVDLQGAFVMPGLMDCHTHFSLASLALTEVDLRGAKTPQMMVDQIAARARTVAKGHWVLGTGWDADQWGGALPDRSWLDKVTGDVPVSVSRYDLHMLLLNSAALRLAGINRDTPDIAGGVIVRDRNGEPTGLLKDTAKTLVEAVIPAYSPLEIDDAMRRGIALGLSKGVTRVHCPEIDWRTHESLMRLRAQGETNLRFYSMVPLPDWERLLRQVQEQGWGDDWVRWGGLKALADGSLGSRSALFQQPYNDDRSTRGVRVHPVRDLLEWTLIADRHNFQVAIHAIGDQATHDVLDIFQTVSDRNGPRDRRFRMEHAQSLQLADIGRFKKENVIASIQPYHAIDDGRWAVRRVGPERLKGTFAYRSIVDQGARFCCGSDWPVAPLDPFTGIQAAVLRQTLDGKNPGGWMPEQKLTLLQALSGYTTGAAYAGFSENRMGRILPGFLADFVVLDKNIFTIPFEQINSMSTLSTIVGGKARYTA